MSKTNRTNYSKMSTTPASDSVIETINNVVEVENETPKLDTDVAIAIVEPEKDALETLSVVNDLVDGFVSGCGKLNVRKEPHPKAEVVCVLDKGTNVVIDESDLTDNYYKVYTEAGAEGYCMKDYITIKQ